ncbi:MAG: NAD-dependent epimerase/dehydratase family protein [Rhodospirillales bacterium]|nr:NAD-dependent epimerase/dehydratase family protein [Rhodospirillales bacterium]
MLEHLKESPVKPKRVVVMGAEGFVGSALVKKLDQEGVPNLALGRGDVNLLEDSAPEKLSSLIEPGDSFVAVSAIAPAKDAEMLIDNLLMVRAMVAALKAREKDIFHVVNISSDAIYADEPTPLGENSPMAPDSYHGVMHLAREIMFKNELTVPLAMLRPTLIYGAADPHNGYGPNRFRRLAQKGEEIELFGEGEERRDHVLVDDVAEIIYLTLMHRSQGALNVATGQVSSFREIAEMVVSGIDFPVPITGSPRTGPMPHGGYRPFDISACRAAFPEFCYTVLEEGIRQTQKEDLREA